MGSMKTLIEGQLSEASLWEPAGYHPEIAYTKLLHPRRGNALVLYFDEDGKHIGMGGIMDEYFTRYIAREEDRKHPDQVVDPKRYFKQAQDEAPLTIKPR
jgi:hypothetical protein